MDTELSGVELEAAVYYQETETFRTQFDQEKTPASMAVIASLADVLDTDPVELDPLYAAIDPDALDALGRVRHETDGDIHVTFTHQNQEITVSSHGVITISREHEPTGEKDARDERR